MTSLILMDIIKFVEDSGFHVVAMMSDLGGSDRGLHNELNFSENKPYFENPTNKENIFVFAHVPHLLKLIRSNFVNDWFDVFNVSSPLTDSRVRNRAYVLALEEQNKILDKMSEVMSGLVIISRGKLPFQKGTQ
nr:unnamed protein product [Callosobruchus analis]